MNPGLQSTKPSSSADRLSAQARVFLIAMIVWTAIAAAYTVLRGSLHDYPAYVVIWELILDGVDPWLGSLPARNAYGPVFVIFAPLVAVNELAPKVAMVATFLLANMFVVWRLLPSANSVRRMLLYVLLVPLNGCIVVWGIAYGSNDVLVAGLVGFALLARIDNRFVLTGFLLGFAVLLKMYPALLVVLFSIDSRRVSLKLLMSSAATVVVGLAVPLMIWGGNSLNWLLFAAERGSSQLSIWNQIINEPWLEFLHGFAFWAIDVNAVLLALIFGAWLAVVWLMRIRWLPASVVGLFLVLVFYKVGHGQFWMTWLILACGLLISLKPADLRFASACLPAALGVSLAAFTYDIRRQLSLPWEPVQQQTGWMFFGLSMLTLALFIWSLAKLGDDRVSECQPLR